MVVRLDNASAELVDILVVVNLGANGLVTLRSVELVEKHLEEDGRAFVG